MKLSDLKVRMEYESDLDAYDDCMRVHAPALIACAEAAQEYLEWGAMTSSDRALFDDKFRAALRALEAA